jgi:2-aminoadipate transaminase
MTDLQSGGSRAGALPFIYGHVDPALFPAEQLREAASLALSRHHQAALNYGASLGCTPLRAFLRAKLEREEGLRLGDDELMLTAGASAGLDTAVRVFAQPGDTVLVEAPTYHEALGIIRDYPVRLAAVPLDDDGLVVDALSERLDLLAGAGERPVLLYTIPCFQNPSGVTMSEERRRALLQLAYRHRLRIVEDDVYRDLYFAGPPPPSLHALDSQGMVIRLGSFSKILAPGLRLGWAVGSAGDIGRMAECGLTTSGGGANPFVAYTVAAFCEQGWLEPHIDRLRQTYRERKDVLLTALEAYMPSETGGKPAWTKPGGGFFVWLTLPASLNARAVLRESEEQGVTFLIGEPFYAEGGGEQQIRLPFSCVDRPDLERGAEIIAGIVTSMLPA